MGEARGRDFRAPPLVRGFVRNAQVSTMALLALALANQTVTASRTGVSVSFGGPGIIGIILLFQLVVVARRLLRDGYGFEDIRGALLAEAQVQAEEADVIKQRRWLRRLDTLWYRAVGRARRARVLPDGGDRPQGFGSARVGGRRAHGAAAGPFGAECLQ